MSYRSRPVLYFAAAMAHQHVYLMQDEAFAVSSLKDPKERNIELVAKVVGLVHPRTGQMASTAVYCCCKCTCSTSSVLSVDKKTNSKRASFWLLHMEQAMYVQQPCVAKSVSA